MKRSQKNSSHACCNIEEEYSVQFTKVFLQVVSAPLKIAKRGLAVILMTQGEIVTLFQFSQECFEMHFSIINRVLLL